MGKSHFIGKNISKSHVSDIGQRAKPTSEQNRRQLT